MSTRAATPHATGRIYIMPVVFILAVFTVINSLLVLYSKYILRIKTTANRTIILNIEKDKNIKLK